MQSSEKEANNKMNVAPLKEILLCLSQALERQHLSNIQMKKGVKILQEKEHHQHKVFLLKHADRLCSHHLGGELKSENLREKTVDSLEWDIFQTFLQTSFL